MNEVNAKRLLFEVADILDDIGVEFLLYCGTLLGAVREKRFIETDTDIDLAILLENLIPIAKKVADQLVKKGMKVHIVDHRLQRSWDGSVYAIKFKGYGERGDLIGFKGIHGKRAVPSHLGNCWRVHTAKFLEELGKIEFYGRTFKVSKDINGILTELYGNWQIPTTKPIYPCKKSESWR